ncbi:MAG: MerR family transcriptional regulator [Oscillospiraceae bacterium]|nr:MerR family transcriptional regulator [Oscillospiraceae bacterium]
MENISISDFAKFSRTTTDTLRHYDKIGLLSPVLRGENNYRYYSIGQLAVVNVIRTLQSLGMTLDEIKKLSDYRTPEHMTETLTTQIDKIDAKIEEWVRARKLLFTLQNTMKSSLEVDENAITVEFLPAKAIILGDLNDYSGDRNDYDALHCFYINISNKYPGLDLNYPVWAVFSEERIKKGDFTWPDRYYFNNPEGYDKIPAALYAIGYTRGGYGQSDEIYKRLIDYIERNDLEICGNAYEEYPLNEVCVADDTNYLMKVMITVQKKNRNRN